jgi:hypothetical protein
MPSLITQFLVAKTTRGHPCRAWLRGLKRREKPASAKKWHRTRDEFGLSCFCKKRSASSTPARNAKQVPKSAIFAGGKAPSEPGDFAPGRALSDSISDERGGEINRRRSCGRRAIDVDKCEQRRRVARDRPGEFGVACLTRAGISYKHKARSIHPSLRPSRAGGARCACTTGQWAVESGRPAAYTSIRE